MGEFEGEGGKRSAWMSHVKKTMKANKGKSLMQVLKMAKKTYKKTGGGIAGSAMPLTQEGARRRRRRGGNEDGEAPAAPAISFGQRAVKADADAAQNEGKTTFGTPSTSTVKKGGRKTRKSGRKSRGTRKH